MSIVNLTLIMGTGSTVLSKLTMGTFENRIKGTSFILVQGKGTPMQNAAELQAAYEAAKLMTPYGAAKSATNRVSIIVAPAKYTFAQPFVVDTAYIDIVSLTGNPDVMLDGISVTANDVKLKGINCGTNAFTITGSSVVCEKCKGLNYTSDLPSVEIVNNLTAGGTTKALSAEMGKNLNDGKQGILPAFVWGGQISLLNTYISIVGNLRNATLQTDLTGYNFEDLDLTGADLRYGNFSNAGFYNATLVDAKFDETVITGTSFENADFEGASFSNMTYVNGADFTDATGLNSNIANVFSGNQYMEGCLITWTDGLQYKYSNSPRIHDIQILDENGEPIGYDTIILGPAGWFDANINSY